MRHVIYLDTLVLLNAVVTYILLLSVREFSAVKTSSVRLITASFLGGGCACCLLLPPMNIVLTVLLQAAVGSLVTFCAFFVRDPKKYFRCCFLYLFMSFCYGGFMYFLAQLWGEFIRFRNGFGYVRIGFWGLLCAVTAVYLLMRLLKRRFGRWDEQFSYRIELRYGERSVKGKAILDSGHFLSDCYNGRAVVIVSRELAEKLLSSRELEELKAMERLSPEASSHGLMARLIPVRTVAGNRFLPAFTCDCAIIENGDRYTRAASVSLAVSDEPFGQLGYDALIGNQIFV